MPGGLRNGLTVLTTAGRGPLAIPAPAQASEILPSDLDEKPLNRQSTANKAAVSLWCAWQSLVGPPSAVHALGVSRSLGDGGGVSLANAQVTIPEGRFGRVEAARGQKQRRRTR